MLPFSKDNQPNFWQLPGSSVQASIVLNQQPNVSFTNLDEISGRVILRCAKPINVTSIVVKLEGESRTRLVGQRTGSTRPDDTKTTLEYHKILYKVQCVFPPANVNDARITGKNIFTLPAGNHEYPWTFKIPFNNACHAAQTTLPGVHFGMSSQGLEVTKEPTRHVKKTLPPSLTGFPGEAEISYFVKATIARQGLLKENPRAFVPFNFLPIEPPRPPLTGAQTYARQRLDFAFTANAAPTKKGKMKSFFSGGATAGGSTGTPDLSIDVRLPEPAIITCNQILPLTIVVKKIDGANCVIYLQSLQIALVGYTKVKAHEFERMEQQSWIIVSKSNMKMQIGVASDPGGTEITLDSSLWQSSPLPNTVAPSFETCNIARHYQIDVRMGLSYSSRTMDTKPDAVILPFKLDTLVYSGIAPPAEVLAKMAAAKGQLHATVATESGSEKPPLPAPLPPRLEGNTDVKPPLSTAAPLEDSYADAPPSYEDAIAADIPPVDGYRPAYVPPPAERDTLLPTGDKKG